MSNNNESDGHRPQHNEESARQHGDVTNEHEPVEPRQGVPFVLHNTNIAEPGANVGSQTDVNHDTVHFHVRQGPAGDVTAKVQRAMERARKAQQYAAGTTGADSEQGHTVHIGPKDPNTGARSVNVATSDGHTRLQIGRHYGDVWINGERAD